jgi:hypothetical protein
MKVSRPSKLGQFFFSRAGPAKEMAGPLFVDVVFVIYISTGIQMLSETH